MEQIRNGQNGPPRKARSCTECSRISIICVAEPPAGLGKGSNLWGGICADLCTGATTKDREMWEIRGADAARTALIATGVVNEAVWQAFRASILRPRTAGCVVQAAARCKRPAPPPPDADV